MKTLLLMRHAHAGPKKPGQSDFDRQLDPRGRCAAAAMGQLLLRENLIPDLILSSAAQRAKDTALLLAQNCPIQPTIEYSSELYSAPLDGYLQILKENCDHQNTILLVGHNPTIESLLEKFTHRFRSLVPAALAHLSFPISHWHHLHSSSPAQFLHLWLPEPTQ